MLFRSQVRAKHPLDEYWRFFDSRDSRNWLINKEKVDSAKRVGARLSAFHIDPNMSPFVLGQNEFSVSNIVKENKICIFNLHGLDTTARIYLGNLFSHAFKNYYNFDGVKTSPPFFVYVDEFQQFITPFFDDMLAQCGKYNISVNLAHQNHSQVNPVTLKTALGNCFTKVVFSCGYEEAEAMAHDYQIKASCIQNLGKYEAYILIGKAPHKVLTFPPPEIPQLILPEKPPTISVNFLRDAWIPV